ncbi:MAG: lysozyme inhibitor LprI family protein [Candidatus Sulfotelmatobacter sp.]
MSRTVKSATYLTLLLLLATLSAFPQDRKQSLSEEDIRSYLAGGSGCKPEDVNVDNLEYFDFTGEGVDEAVVVASTCATGTAGPDVHAVLSRRSDGSIIELKIPAPSEKQQVVLLGRVFSDLSVEDALLVQTFHDTSGREDPLIIKYRWSGKDREFHPVDVKTPQRYKTSFDCDRATAGVEAAVCYSSDVASLDIQVDGIYKRWLDSLNDEESDVLRSEQRDWLRKRNLICGSDWAIVECLSILYRARLLELGAFKHLHP